ncbi:YnbE family lipoprotein [Nitrosomonas sp. Nm58]|uniref:YnbE family lipoprotein n=1 Tax=Nitrosomonas sp. Nm58 TaxID=200126 RepID=UPI0021094DC1|nr:YnbE family lipoprotein [Nitrosomonas sp. Nm58]
MYKTHRTKEIPSAIGSWILCCLVITACAPTVKVKAPKEPITINLNVKLDADIRVKLEEEAKKDIEANPNVF